MAGFSLIKHNGIEYLKVCALDSYRNVRALISTRNGGVSNGGYSSLNCGLKSGDSIETVRKNISLLCTSAGIDSQNLVFSDQIHGNSIRVVGKSDIGKGFIIESDICGIDSLVTADKNTALCIFTADCVPVFLYDTINDVIGLSHAGWKGTASGIVAKTIDTMISAFNTKPENIVAAIGPSIGPCCFEVKDDVKNVFDKQFKHDTGIVEQREGKTYVNLQKAVLNQLVSSGVNDNNIYNSELCTCCRKDMFFSYRRDGSITGRMISIIELV